MRDFDVQNSRWKTREALPEDCLFLVELLGLDGNRMEMEQNGWSFLMETNHFTGNKKLLAKHCLGMTASGYLKDGYVMLMNLCNQRYANKLNADFVRIDKKEAVDLAQLSPSHLLDILGRVYSQPKKKISRVVDIEEYVDSANQKKKRLAE